MLSPTVTILRLPASTFWISGGGVASYTDSLNMGIKEWGMFKAITAAITATASLINTCRFGSLGRGDGTFGDIRKKEEWKRAYLMRVLTLILDFSLSLLRMSHQFRYSCKQSWTWAWDVRQISRVAIGRTLKARFAGSNIIAQVISFAKLWRSAFLLIAYVLLSTVRSQVIGVRSSWGCGSGGLYIGFMSKEEMCWFAGKLRVNRTWEYYLWEKAG